MTIEDDGRPKAPEDEIEYLNDDPAEIVGPAEAEGPAEPGAPGKKPRPKIDPAVAKAFRARIRRKDDQIQALKGELAGFKDQYVRKLAETDNLRKRLEREKNEYYQFALSEVLLELLGIVDNFERAAAAAEQEAECQPLFEGVQLTLRQLLGLLQKRGVRVIESEGRPFDPAVHNAMLTEESDAVSEPAVGEVLQKGYLLEGRLLRPALVKVLVPRKKE